MNHAKVGVNRLSGLAFENEVCGNCAEKRDQLLNSGAGNAGVLTINQAAGNMNNQANALSIALSLDAGVALSEADLGQFNTGNTVHETNVGTNLEGAEPKTARITASVNGNSGVVGVNQSSGNMANQAIVRVLTLGPVDSPVQGLDLAGSARSLENTLISSGGEREDRISNSFGRTVGIVGANQSAGNLNQQANVLVLGIGATFGPEVVALMGNFFGFSLTVLTLP